MRTGRDERDGGIHPIEVGEREREIEGKNERAERNGVARSERKKEYIVHISSARSIGECLGRRTWTTHTVPRDHRASPLAYIRLHGSPKTIPWPALLRCSDRPIVAPSSLPRPLGIDRKSVV